MARIGFMALEGMSFENVEDGRLYKIMLHYLILRYICHSIIYQCFKVVNTVCTRRLTLFVPEWFESAGLMMHMGCCSDFLNQNKLKTLMDPRAFGELENIGYCM